jgi:hypothetical protein
MIAQLNWGKSLKNTDFNSYVLFTFAPVESGVAYKS